MRNGWTVIGLALLCAPSVVRAGLVVEDLGKSYDHTKARLHPQLMHHLEDQQVMGGNTSLRNEPAEHLSWKADEGHNGSGYFNRNRDLGQVFNTPAEGKFTIDAVVLRTAKGKSAVKAGTPGAKVYVQFFEVSIPAGQELKINENGTPTGTRAKHGFDHKFHRADDYLENVVYRPIARAHGGVIPAIEPTTQPAYKDKESPQFGEQPGHLRFLRFDLTGEDEITLEPGRRYAFMIGFEEPAKDRGMTLANENFVGKQLPPKLNRDAAGLERWSIRREGDGTLPPTMIEGPQPPADSALRQSLLAESLFAENHYDTLAPTTNGYPDVDTYRTHQFYLELK